MSRVTYTHTPATTAQETLRATHGVRLVRSEEEGCGIDTLPGGVYGFTYSPGLPNAPLFAERRYRSFETHKLASGEAFVIGFAAPEDAALLASPAGELTVRIQPGPEEACTVLVAIPYSRIRQHRQYAAPNQHGFTVTVRPALAHV
jgi:hypothetical protein